LIFPEGTRGPGDQVATFQAGLYRLAKHAPKVPVVPVTLKNLSRILPKGETIPVPHLSQVIVHKPLSVGIDEPQDDFLSRARNILSNELIAEADSQCSDASLLQCSNCLWVSAPAWYSLALSLGYSAMPTGAKPVPR